MTWKVRVVVNRVIDGDTFDGDADLGWGVWRCSIKGAWMRFRILGIDTPERGQPGYADALGLLAAIIPPETSVWVESTALDSFGRALVNVTLSDGTNLRDLIPEEWWV